MKKRLLGIILVAAMSISLIACGETTKESKVEIVPETETVEVAQEPTVTETEEPQEAVVPTNVEAKAEEVKTEETTESAESAESTSGTDVADTTPKTPTYTYTDTSATMYAKSSVNVRDLPDTSGNKLGGLSTNDEVKVTGKCNETGWYRIEYKGGTAYVSNSYLVSEKVEVAPPADTSGNGGNNGGGQSSGGNSASHWYDNYEMHTWYDMGTYIFALSTGYTDRWWTVDGSGNNPQQVILRERFPGYEAGLCAKQLADGVLVEWWDIYDANYNYPYYGDHMWK